MWILRDTVQPITWKKSPHKKTKALLEKHSLLIYCTYVWNPNIFVEEILKQRGSFCFLSVIFILDCCCRTDRIYSKMSLIFCSSLWGKWRAHYEKCLVNLNSRWVSIFNSCNRNFPGFPLWGESSEAIKIPISQCGLSKAENTAYFQKLIRADIFCVPKIQ